ncbi:hypothetical protein MRX96_049741 [Rhipicephalus microplus]
MALHFLSGDAFPRTDFILQQYCSKVHTPKLTFSFLQTRGVAVLEWPPQSQVMNIIENIWGNMKAVLCSRNLHDMSSENLSSATQDCLEETRANVQTCDAFYASLADRMRAVIEAHVDATHF